jgi:adenylate kinase
MEALCFNITRCALQAAMDMRSKLILITLLGAPGSGKGTQCKLLSRALGIPGISSGDMLRSHVQRRTELGLLASKAMQRGELVQDEIVCGMLSSRIVEADCAEGFVLDGIPRTLHQAEFLELQLKRLQAGARIVRIVVSLELERGAALRRLGGRRICPECSASYNVELRPPRLENRCDNDGAELLTREDDREEICGSRFDAYAESGLTLKRYYRSRYRVHEMNGARPAKEIQEEILGIVAGFCRVAG